MELVTQPVTSFLCNQPFNMFFLSIPSVALPIIMCTRINALKKHHILLNNLYYNLHIISLIIFKHIGTHTPEPWNL